MILAYALQKVWCLVRLLSALKNAGIVAASFIVASPRPSLSRLNRFVNRTRNQNDHCHGMASNSFKGPDGRAMSFCHGMANFIWIFGKQLRQNDSGL